MKKFDLKNITWRELPRETFITKVNDEEVEVEVQALTGQDMIEISQLPEKQRICFLLSRGLLSRGVNISMQEAQELLNHEVNLAGEIAKKIFDLSVDFHKMMNDDSRGK